MKKRKLLLFIILLASAIALFTVNAFAADAVTVRVSDFESEQGEIFSSIVSVESTGPVEAFETSMLFDTEVVSITSRSIYTFGTNQAFDADGKKYVVHSFENSGSYEFTFFEVTGNASASEINSITKENYTDELYSSFSLVETDYYKVLKSFKKQYGIILLCPEILINIVDNQIITSWTPNNTNINGTEMFMLQFVAEENLAEGSYPAWLVEDSDYESFAEYNETSLDISFDIANLSIYGYGDINFDHKVDTRDALRARQHSLKMDGKILSGLRFKLGDVNFDSKVNTRDALYIQKYKIKLIDTIGNRFNVTFYDGTGAKYYVKSVVVGSAVVTIPEVPAMEGYSQGKWSLSQSEYIEPNYTNIQNDISVYAYYDSTYTSDAMEYYKKQLTKMYYSGDMPTNLSSDQELETKLYYQEGQYATLIWSSDCNYVLNSTTGAFTKPTYPQDLSLTASITSYDSNNRIESEGEITFKYAVPGEYTTPTKASVEDFLKFYFTDDADGKYRVNYDVKLITKINNTVIPVEGTMYDNFEIRLSWYQNVNGNLVPVSQIKRTTSSQLNDYVAIVTFNGKPLEDDGKIYIDDVEVTAIEQMEIRNHIIQQIAAKQGTLATDECKLWNDDKVYGTSVTWETGNADIAYIANNTIQLKDDAVTGATLPLNARVSYAVDGGTEEFILSYNLTVSCDNTIIKAPENMDPGLYKAIKIELEDTLGYRGDLTSAALANVKFVNLDLSKYQKQAIEYNKLRAEYPEQYPNDDYPEILSLKGLSYCKNLRTLNISGIKVNDIKDGTVNQIATLSYLEAFIARDCGLDNLTDGGTATLRNAVNLKMIDLTNNNFTSLDSVFAEGVRYGSLREVYLSNNKLTDINALSRAPMMTYLSLSGNGLTTEGTASIANFPYLLYLSLANNNIDSVEHLAGLKYLTELRLQHNNLSNVNALRRLVNLQILYLGHNNIKDIGNLNTLTQLQILYVNDNQIFDVSTLRELTKLEAINVSNNKISSLSVLINYKSTLKEVYAENNNITDFSFINGANNLHILMLAGNKVELAQDNMTNWLSSLSGLEVLTLSDIRLNNLSFLETMTKLVRLDVANCGINAFSGDASNIQMIADRYATLKVLDISNNDFSDGEDEILKLRNITLLSVLYADNICSSLDAYTLTYSMTELKYLSMENCGITSINWLYKFNNLVYVDLAGNNISDVNIESQISNASVKTLKELYLDTNVPCSFANAYRVMDFGVEKLSLEGITVGKMEYLPWLDNIKYLNLDSTGLKNLTGEDPELADLYSIERYTGLETLDISNNETSIAVVEKMPTVKTLYAVGATDSKRFYEDNLHSLQRLYNKDVVCYLYDKNTKYEPVAQKEGAEILGLIDDFSCDVTVAADNVSSDNNPFIIDEINDYDITWTVSNSDNYQIKDNHLSVKNYKGIEDETLTITASIVVYPDQEAVTRDFTINTTIVRASPKYYQIDATGYSEQLTRDSVFNYNLTLKAAETEGFSVAVKPVEDNITYSYAVVSESGLAVPYEYALVINDNNRFAIASDAPLDATITINIDITHTAKSGDIVNDAEQIKVPVTVASRTFTATFVMNGGTIVDANGISRESCEFVEDSWIFEKLIFGRPGYVFRGWYTDETLETLFSKEGIDEGVKTKMPSNNITLFAKWEALSYTVNFDANGGTSNIKTMTALSDVELGELPIPERMYYTFDGWFTSADGGEEVTSTSKFARTEDITLYAHWTLNSFIITFDANGGTVDTSEIRAYCGENIGTLPIPTRDYYTFAGWYTKVTDGDKVTSASKYDTASDITLYAHWVINATSAWVKKSEMPSDAQVVAQKWSYNLRSYETSTSSSLSGWTKYDSKITSYGSEIGPVYSNPSNGVRKVRSESYISSYGTKHIYHFHKWGYSELDYSYSYSTGGRTEYHVYLDYYPSNSSQRPVAKDGGTFKWYANGTGSWAAVYFVNEYDETDYSKPNYSTRWYYQEPIYTYYFYKDEAKESTSYPNSGEVSNVVEWVQYIPKTVTYSQVSQTIYGDHTYELISCPYALSWDMAKAYCEQSGGHLATITSVEEQNAISSLGEEYAWIGGFRNSENSWKWVTDEPFGYTNWRSGEPNNGEGIEDRVGIYPDHGWNDYSNTTTSVSHLIIEYA